MLTHLNGTAWFESSVIHKGTKTQWLLSTMVVGLRVV